MPISEESQHRGSWSFVGANDARQARSGSHDSIYCLPVGSASLVYAPLHGVAALVSQDAAARLGLALDGSIVDVVGGDLKSILTRLRGNPAPLPSLRTGGRANPLFLGIIPTRDCNMECGYCDFASSTSVRSRMSADVAQAAVDAYLAVLEDAALQVGQIHFFGGEPLIAPGEVEFVVEYASARARDAGIRLHFEVTTNGLLSVALAEWVADTFDTVVLSFDGPPGTQDRQRPARHNRPSFDVVRRTAGILSDGPVELIVRSCVTSATVDHLPGWVQWIVEELRPSTVCLESMTPSPRSAAANLFPPDPYRFAQAFISAACILESRGITVGSSTTDLSACRVSACPVGQDALIVSPQGIVDGCYLLENEWLDRGLDLRLGLVDVAAGRFEVGTEALERMRHLAAREKPQCVNCFCRDHCAGGCHVHHDTNRPPADYDDLCLATRLISAGRLLGRLGLSEVATWLLDDADASSALARHPDDHLLIGAAL